MYKLARDFLISDDRLLIFGDKSDLWTIALLSGSRSCSLPLPGADFSDFPPIYQAFLMSATLSDDVMCLRKLVLHNPVSVLCASPPSVLVPERTVGCALRG